MALQPLVSEEPELTLLTVKRRSVINHLRVDLYFMNPLHVVSQLLQILKIMRFEKHNSQKAIRNKTDIVIEILP